MSPKSLYQTELETIAKSRILFSEDTDGVLRDIGQRLANCLGIQRVNIWLFNETRKQLICIANYDNTSSKFSKGESIYEADIPYYYSHLLTDEILVINNIHTNPVTNELKDNYCKEHNIFSMMDVPIFIEGELAGVMCYEQVGKLKKWTEEEQFFVLAINQLVSLVLETRKRKEAQVNLQKALQDKERLLAEMHHRIKNNLSMLVSLLRLQVRESKNKAFIQLANDFENRIFAIAKIHEQLYSTRNYIDISLKLYLEQLIHEYSTSYPEITFNVHLADCHISTHQIVPLGLMCNEVITNSIKHAFPKYTFSGKPEINISLQCSEEHITFILSDNGNGFDVTKEKEKETLGLSLVDDLVQQINGTLLVETATNKGTVYTVTFDNPDIFIERVEE